MIEKSGWTIPNAGRTWKRKTQLYSVLGVSEREGREKDGFRPGEDEPGRRAGSTPSGRGTVVSCKKREGGR